MPTFRYRRAKPWVARHDDQVLGYYKTWDDAYEAEKVFAESIGKKVRRKRHPDHKQLVR
jgi:hypothetical protein